jgi:outer membrane immunogenic protein
VGNSKTDVTFDNELWSVWILNKQGRAKDMCRHAAIAAVTLGLSLGFSAAASAADVFSDVPAPAYAKAPEAPFTWSGFYVGAEAGAGWGTSTEGLNSFADCVGSLCVPVPVIPNAFGSNYGINGWHGGATAGFNWQINQIVLGVEGDWSAADIEGSGTDCGFASQLVLSGSCSTRLGYFATMDGRIGFALDRILWYLKGGGAYGHFSDTIITSATPFSGPSFAATDNRWGVTAGVGVEFAFWQNWSAMFEYDYIDFGSRALSLVNTGGGIFAPLTFNASDTIREQVSVIRAGVNYRFDWYNSRL